VTTHKYFEHSIESLKEPAFLLDRNCNCVFANKALFSFLGYKTKSDFLDIFSFWPSVNSVGFSNCDLTTEFHLRHGDSNTVKLAVTVLEDGFKFCRIVASSSKNKAVHFMHTQKLETLGLLAGGIAHDFNNILAGILGHITYLKTILPSSGNHIESLQAVEEGAKKASSLTQQILSFSKPENEEKPAKINLSNVVSRTCSLLRGAISTEYKIEMKLPDSPIYVLGSEGKIAQIIANLVINARDAITANGIIKISVRKAIKKGELDSVFHGLDRSSPSYAVLEIQDNGHGIAPDVLKRVFEPYFSTKHDKGTGLGLATVEAIVKLLGGTIEIKSEVNVGTVVSVYIPEMDSGTEKTENQHSAKYPENLVKGTGKILVVDDEYPVRNVLCMSLEHLGYDVEVAASGNEAIQIFKDDPKFDLVILDMIMPHLSGDEVFFVLKEINPDVSVLLVSGYSSEESIQKVLKSGGKGFIQKPFTIEQLSSKVCECLNSKRQ